MPKVVTNRLAAGALILAALACMFDVPRLHVLSAMGDTLNAVRVLDPVSHIQLAARAALDTDLARELRTDLDEGRRSVELIASTPALVAAVPPMSLWTPPTLAPDTPDDGLNFLPAPIAALPGALLHLDIPPPRTRCDLRAPMQLASVRVPALLARAPPLR